MQITICMNCQILFVGEKKILIISLSFAEMAQREIKVKKKQMQTTFGFYW